MVANVFEYSSLQLAKRILYNNMLAGSFNERNKNLLHKTMCNSCVKYVS